MKRKLKLGLGLGILLVVVGVLMVPLPIHATIAEGEIEVPEPLRRIITTKLNFVFTLYNSNFSFKVEDDNITVWAEKTEFLVLMSKIDDATKILVRLHMENCRFQSDTFKSHIGKLTLYIHIKMLEDKTVCSVETKTLVPIYKIIGNLITNRRV